MPALPDDVTQLLLKCSRGDKAALDELMPVIYSELRRLSRRYMARERPGHTLQTTALINEAYLRLVDQQSVQWQDRAHFFAVAAQVMRYILVDHARKYQSDKRDAGAQKLAFEDVAVANEDRAAELVELNEAPASD
jgi:RNA polymerase sigma factor (TIGR02999 family)